MAQIAQTRAVNTKIKAFAAKTAADQQKDIEELRAHRNHWYAGKPLMDRAMMDSMMKSMHTGMNMNMEEVRRKLRAALGVLMLLVTAILVFLTPARNHPSNDFR